MQKSEAEIKVGDKKTAEWNPILDDLSAELRSAITKTFEKLIGDTPRSAISGLAVYCDDNGTWLSAAVEPTKDLKAKQKERPEVGREYRWSPPEWSRTDVELSGDKPLTTLMKRIQEERGELTDGEVRRWTFLLMEWCVEQLAGLVEDGWFDDFGDDTVIVVTIVDLHIDDQSRIEWMSTLNSEELMADYRKWLAGDTAV